MKVIAGLILIGIAGSLLIGVVVAALADSLSGRDKLQASAVDSARPEKRLSDALLLYDSGSPQLGDADFLRVANFYGLSTAKLDLLTAPLTEASLRDSQGRYYRTVFATGTTLEANINQEQAALLKDAIRSGGLNLMVGSFRQANSTVIQSLTDGEVRGTTVSKEPGTGFRVSHTWPDITRELTGIIVGTHDNRAGSYSLNTASHTPRTQPLLTALRAQAAPSEVFDVYSRGEGQVFISSEQADPTLSARPMSNSYSAQPQPDGTYLSWGFGQLVPLMMFVRYTAGDLAWHQNHDYANLTIDDPALRMSQLDYARLVKYAGVHNFSVTIAMPPKVYARSEPAVVELFHRYSDLLSLVQHGNNHDDYEFYKYTVDASDKYPARPRSEQEADIVEGATRMEAHAALTGIPYGRIMIFPSSPAPKDTLTLLKEYNFQATINALDHPLDAPRATLETSYMYPAELEYGDFAFMLRSHARDADYPFDLFIGKPVLIYEHGDFFRHGYSDFDPYADGINAVQGKVEWKSLDYIVKHLYLEKAGHTESSGRDVMFFGNDVVISNDSSEPRTYYARRQETGDVPIAGVTLDERPVEYLIQGGVLEVKFSLDPERSAEIKITYRPPNRDFALGPEGIALDRATGAISVTVHNTGKTAGPAPVGFFAEANNSGRTLLALSTARLIEPGSTGVVTATLAQPLPATLTVMVDPYNVIGETDETNNKLTTNLSPR